jgi:GPI biosynthesis protein family Pig-F
VISICEETILLYCQPGTCSAPYPMSSSLQSHSHQTLLHSILLFFSLVFLPRSSYPYSAGGPDAPAQTKSADKPQAAWLNPLTYDPHSSLLWWILGSIVICISRAGWARRESDGNRGSEGKDGRALLIRLLRAFAATILFTPLTTIFLVLLGAPLASDSATFSLSPNLLTPLLALLLNVLVLFIPCYVFGLPITDISATIASIPGLSTSGISSTLRENDNKSAGATEQVLNEWTRLFVQLSFVLRFLTSKL